MNQEGCIFCRIVQGKAPAVVLYRDETITAFQDAHPQAPIHILVVPNQHLASVNEMQEVDEALLGHMVRVAKTLAIEKGVGTSGYRLVINTGAQAGQSVMHLHLHIIGGRHLPFQCK